MFKTKGYDLENKQMFTLMINFSNCPEKNNLLINNLKKIIYIY